MSNVKPGLPCMLSYEDNSQYEYMGVSWIPTSLQRHLFGISHQNEKRLWRKWMRIYIWVSRMLLGGSITSGLLIGLYIIVHGEPINKQLSVTGLVLLFGVPTLASFLIPLCNWMVRRISIRWRTPQTMNDFIRQMTRNDQIHKDEELVIQFRDALGRIYGVNSSLILAGDTGSSLQRFAGLNEPFAFELILEMNVGLEVSMSNSEISELTDKIGGQASTVEELYDLVDSLYSWRQ